MPQAPPATGGWQVDLEVVLLSATPDGGLGYRVLIGALPADGVAEPDEAALALAGHSTRTPLTVSHATSWRCPSPGRLVLTYAVLPDPDPAGAEPLHAPSIVCSDDPLRPAPPGLHAHHVAAHAVRHLAYLGDTDPTVAAGAAHDPALWALLRHASRSLPVDRHDAAHALALQWRDRARPVGAEQG